RYEIRHGCVTADQALASGRASDAVAPAEAAARLSREHLAARHAAKSDIVLAVALTTAGDPDGRARRLAVDALDTATTAGWYSLCWPAALAAADATPHDGGEEPRRPTCVPVRQRTYTECYEPPIPWRAGSPSGHPGCRS